MKKASIKFIPKLNKSSRHFSQVCSWTKNTETKLESNICVANGFYATKEVLINSLQTKVNIWHIKWISI